MSIATVEVGFEYEGEWVDGYAEVISYVCDHGCVTGEADNWEEPYYDCEFEVYLEDDTYVGDKLTNEQLDKIADKVWDYMQERY